MPTEHTRPITMRINFIFLTAPHDPNLPEGHSNPKPNFQQNDPVHQRYIDRMIAGIKETTDGTTGPKQTCDPAPGPPCPDLGSDWIGDSKIRFDIQKYWITDPVLWNNDPLNKYNDGQLNNSDYYSVSLHPGRPTWYLWDFAQNIYDTHGIRQGLNVFFTTDGNAYYDYVLNDLPVVWAPFASAHNPDEGRFDENMITHMSNRYLDFAKQVKNGASQSELDGNAYTIGRVIFHEIGHNFSFGDERPKQFPATYCKCNFMSTNSFGDFRQNMITPEQLQIIHKMLGVSSNRNYITCEKIPLYSDYNVNLDAIRITDNQVWDFDVNVYEHIVVETGGTLTITCRVGMPKGGQIIVKRGGQLYIDGGIVTYDRTTNESCESGYWSGIEVWGNSKAAQSIGSTAAHSGYVHLDNALLENAEIAIKTARTDAPWFAGRLYYGGIIQAYNSKFENNKRGVAFYRYKEDNISEFITCDFTSGDPNTYAGATLAMVRGVDFESCFFDNLGNVGVQGINADFKVEDCTFTSIAHGVEASASFGGVIDVDILGNTFTDNFVGVYGDAGNGVNIRNNEMTGTGTSFGAHFLGTSQYRIEENTFTSLIYGVNSDQAGSNGLILNCNIYEDVSTGNRIAGNNQGFLFMGENYDEGNGCGTSVYIREASNSERGRIARGQGSPGNPVYNVFSSSGADIVTQSFSTTNRFFYVHPENPTDTRLIPECPSRDFSCSVRNNFVNFDSNDPDGEPDCLDDVVMRIVPPECDGIGKACLPVLEDKIDDLKTILADGDLSQFYAGLDINPNSTLLIQALTTASPYLSDGVLIKIIESNMNDVDRYSLLDSNEPLSIEVNHYIDSLLSEATYGDFEYLAEWSDRDSIDYLLEVRERYVPILVNESVREALILNDSIGVDTLIAFLEDGVYKDRLAYSVKVYQEDYTTARNIITNWPVTTNAEIAFALSQEVNLDYLEFGPLGLDTNQVASLYQYVDDDTDASGYVRATLTLVDDAHFNPTIPEDDESGVEEKNESTLDQLTAYKAERGLIKVMPNPVTNYLNILFPSYLIEQEKDLRISLVSMVGKQIQDLQVNSTIGSAGFSVREFPAGIYFLNVTNRDGNLIVTKKVVIK